MPQDKQGAPERRNLTVRLTPTQWRRVRDLALDLDVTVQDMLVAGLNRIFIENRRPPLHSKLGFLDPNYQIKEHEDEYEPKIAQDNVSSNKKSSSLS